MLMELELLWLLAPDLPTSSWLGGTNTACLGMGACTPSWLRGANTACLGMSTCTACSPSWLGGLTYELLTATTLIHTNGAGITVAAGTRLTLEGIGGGVTNYVSCLGESACTACQLVG